MSEPLLYRDEELRTREGQAAAWPRLALLGERLEHSLSPLLHEAALCELGLPGSYRAIEVEGAELAGCLQAARRGKVVGLNLTFPHKRPALDAAVAVGPTSEETGAANTLVATRRGWEAHNTDVGGLVDALRECFLDAPWRGECVVVGAGGAARAAVAALGRLGCARVRILARHPERAQWARVQGAEVESLAGASLERCSLLLQATPLGLSPDDPSPVDPAALPAGCSVMDLTYGLRPSRLLRAHEGRGPVADGRWMLLSQAIRAFRLWFPGHDPASAMRRALEKALS